MCSCKCEVSCQVGLHSYVMCHISMILLEMPLVLECNAEVTPGHADVGSMIPD